MPNFPIKKEGDGLGAEHVNWLTEGVKNAEAFRVSGFNMNGSGIPPTDIRMFDVVEEECDGNPELYRVVSRYWDLADEEWKSGNKEDDRGFRLDATDTGQVFAVDDKVQAYYDPQRGAFIPLSSSSGVLSIRFRIVTVFCELCQAIAVVMSRPPGMASVPQEDIYGMLRVYDLHGWLQEPDIDLEGRYGAASLRTWETEACAIDPALHTKWEIDSLYPIIVECPVE